MEGNVKLNILKNQLAEIHPADLADIVEELDSSQRVALLEGLDTEHASGTLGVPVMPVQSLCKFSVDV